MRLFATTMALLAVSITAVAEPTSRPQPDLANTLAKALPLRVESLGVPVKSVIAYNAWPVPNPDGKSHDLLQWYYKDYSGPTRVYIIDLATGQVKKDSIADKLQLHMSGRVFAPDGRLFFATPSSAGMELFVYDPGANKLEKRGVIVPGLGGETRGMTLGPDGMIYGTGDYTASRKAGLYRLDPKTGTVRDYGHIGPSHAPNRCWGYYLRVDDKFAYVASGKIPWYLVAVDLASGKSKVLLQTKPYGKVDMAVKQTDGAVYAVVTEDDSRREYWLHHGKMIPKQGNIPPFKAPPRPTPPMPARPEIHMGQLQPDAKGNAVLWYQLQRKGEWQSVELSGVETYPVKIHRLMNIGQGRLYGVAKGYHGSFIHDTRTGKSTFLGKGGSSQYAYAMAGGKLYWSGYPSGPVYRYDPSLPWTLKPKGRPDERKSVQEPNPRMFGTLYKTTRAKKMFKAAVGADGCVYIGGIGQRDYNGGSFGWLDVKTGKLGGIWKPFSGYKIHSMIAADEGRVILLSTKTVRDELNKNIQAPDGKIFVWDTAKGRITREIVPVPGGTMAGPIISTSAFTVLGATRDPAQKDGGIVYSVDIRDGKVLFRRSVPAGFSYEWSNGTGSNDLTCGPDGNGYTFMGNVLVRIRAADGEVEVLGRLDEPGRITFVGDDAYLTATPQLRIIRGLLKAAPH